jgi:methyl-accepting chemotaxis protein
VARDLLDAISNPDETVVVVIDRELSRVVAHSAGGADPGALVTGTGLAGPLGSTTTALDGTDRFVAEAPVAGTHWTVVAGIPVSIAAAEGRDAATQAAQAGAVTLLIVLALILVLYRNLLRPIETLTAAIRRMAAGDADARAPVQGPTELAEVAAEFNHMADQRAVAEAELAYQALHDPLTGLPNRALFLNRLNQAIPVLPWGCAPRPSTPGRLSARAVVLTCSLSLALQWPSRPA